MTAYTFSCFSIFAQSYEEDEKRAYILQNVLMFMMQFLAYAVMYLKTEEHKLLLFFAVQVVLLVSVILLYSILYPNVSRLIVNNMCMLLSAGLIMITRLSYESAVKQFIFIALGTAFGLVVPVLIRKLKFLADWVYIYAGVGFAALLLVAVFAATSGGAKLGFTIGGIGIQPSEFVKILFVFYVAASLKNSTEFKKCGDHYGGGSGSCADPGGVYGSGRGADFVCGVPGHAVRGDKAAAVCRGRAWGRQSGSGGRLSSVCPH